jgi:signal transduction histidine kinase
MARAFREGDSGVFDLRVRRPDGRWAQVEGSATRVPGESGGPDLLLSIMRDVSERQRLRDQLLQAHKMEAVGSLAGGVAHDFNNILSVVAGYAELAAERAADDEQRRRYLHEIVIGAERGRALTEQLLGFARRGETAPESLDVTRVLAAAEPLLRSLVSADVALELDLDESLPAVYMNRTRLERILLNLAANAGDAMRGRPGTLRLVTRRQGNTVVLEVADTGAGMDAATKARIFEPFFTTKPLGEGPGIGLPTVFAAVRDAHGAIEVESEPGVGTTVRIAFPAEDTVASTLPAPALPAPRVAGRGTVLVAEDEAAVRALVETALQDDGYNVLVAADGTEGLRVGLAHLDELGLLLTDFRMPGMNGHELAGALRERRPELPVLVMSGYRDSATLLPGARAIPKPFSLADLSRAVHEAFAQGDGPPTADPA